MTKTPLCENICYLRRRPIYPRIVSFIPDRTVLSNIAPWLASLTFLSVSIQLVQAEEVALQEEALWAFKPLSNPNRPEVETEEWVRNPIDAFILSKLEKSGLEPTSEADRQTLIRRASFDLIGLPPTPDEVADFVNDPRSDAYERLIDRLLDSPRYGERYARHWLDLVRYADSDGYKADQLRPNAWRYRDYVIESFNEDKPYSRFVEEQIAGDELYPDSDAAKMATGYLRLWPYEDNQPDMGRHWEAILNDMTDVTGDVFLGLSMKCARCHDHKFDPISQKDYYKLQSFFAALSPWEEVYLGGEDAEKAYQKQLSRWEEATVELRAEIEFIESASLKIGWDAAFAKLPPYVQDIVLKNERTPYEEQLARFAEKMIGWRSNKDLQKNIAKEDLEEWKALTSQLAEYDKIRPMERERVASVRDVGKRAPKVFVESKGKKAEVDPGYLAILGLEDPEIEPVPENPNTTGRRAALADWLTEGSNQLTTRVMANRLWQWHFGQGIVASSNDFGYLGDRPSHPELLDWLAVRFVEEGWSLKAMHRLIMTSSTYRQGSVNHNKLAERVDADTRLLWRMPVRRMDAEQLRDSMLFVGGDMDLAMGGPGVSEEDSSRRSIYVLNKRNKLRTMMNKFDTPDLHNSCHMRDVTTTALQALSLMNGEWSLTRAESFAERLLKIESDGVEKRIVAAYEIALGRTPEVEEIQLAQSFIEEPSSPDSWVDLCHVLLNTNEFIYIN
ncbi:MAG: hypothetical protein CMI15_06970 [Opitutaceae bacterium]|nr:hypothetical protein [Opitutaceae bacterium]